MAQDNLKKTTSQEDWEEIGKQARKAQHELNELGRLIFGSVPKTIYRKPYEKADEGLGQLRSDLEDRMAVEHPDWWEMDTFYGPIPPEDDVETQD